MLKQISLAALFVLSTLSSSQADIVDFLDFSIAGQGSTHDTSGSDPLESSPVVGGAVPNDWTLTFDAGSVSSDGTTNEFITVGGVMRVQDWGGPGTITGSTYTVTGDVSLDIVGAGVAIGGDVFNNVGVEGITWFYSINGGDAVEQFLGETELGGPVAGGTDVGFTFGNVAVSAGDQISYGFTVNVNGANDGVEISSMELDFTPVPEPGTTLALGALFGVAALRRRRK